jgi:hypothetical protein
VGTDTTHENRFGCESVLASAANARGLIQIIEENFRQCVPTAGLGAGDGKHFYHVGSGTVLNDNLFIIHANK